jgi:hypothetical protein
MNPRWLAGLVVACCLLGCPGCGKSRSGASPSDASTAGASDASVAATLAELTQSVRKFAAEQRQAPKTLDELVAKGYLERIPPAPTGRQYAINQRLEVYLADHR